MAKGNMTIRMEPELKAQAAALFKTLGMDLSTATGIFYRQALRCHGLPFEVKVDEPNATTYAAMEAAVKQIQREWKNPSPKPVLIEGVTGSGKTQVYIKLIEQTLSQGKEAIVLIPEIALTYQTVRRFYARFGDKVSVINSRQSQGERYDQFKRAKKGEV